MSDLSDQMAKLLDDKLDKNYDPRMEELMRSDKLIDPKAENLSDLRDEEIFSVAKIRGAQKAFQISIRKIKKLYLREDMLGYHTDYIDYIRDLDEKNEHDKLELDSNVGDFKMVIEMVHQLVYLRPALEGNRAKLYADSIKPQVANIPVQTLQPEQQEGLLSKMFGFFFGKKEQSSGSNSGYKGR